MVRSPGGTPGSPSSLRLVSDFHTCCVLTEESRAHALEILKKISWFAVWDPLALEIYVDYQMYDDKSTEETKLKTAGIWVCILPHANRLRRREDAFTKPFPQEAATFMEVRVPFEVWDRIGELDQRIRLHYIQPEYCILPCVP